MGTIWVGPHLYSAELDEAVVPAVGVDLQATVSESKGNPSTPQQSDSDRPR